MNSTATRSGHGWAWAEATPELGPPFDGLKLATLKSEGDHSVLPLLATEEVGAEPEFDSHDQLFADRDFTVHGSYVNDSDRIEFHWNLV